MKTGDRVRLSAEGREIFRSNPDKQGVIRERTRYTIPHCERVEFDGGEVVPNLSREFLEVVT